MATSRNPQHAQEIAHGERFEFGKNWQNFLKMLTDERIEKAEQSLCDMLRVDNLQGKTFLDIGCGSGLFSLVARRLGATVHSFDYDPQAVACAQALKQRYFRDDTQWVIEAGSVLDTDYLASLGQFEIVYSWGVLHHTGQMWQALDHVCGKVAETGKLFIAIYNNGGPKSVFWRKIKKTYNALPSLLKRPYAIMVLAPFQLRAFISNPKRYIKAWSDRDRGMSHWHDLIDWVGGYPYEVATAEQLIEFYRERGFSVTHSKLVSGLGNNEFVFQRSGELS